MPDPTDDTLTLSHNGDDQMAIDLHEQNMAQLGQLGLRLHQVGTVAHENFTQTTKFADLDYLEGKRLVGLTEAMGVREVASKSVPAGPASS